MNRRIAFVLGTRPEIIKLAPVIRECEDANLPFEIIHTGQHYNENLDGVFFDQLELPEPDHNLGVGSAPHAAQTGRMMIELEPLIADIDPEIVLVQGDTNSVLAAALVASKLPVSVGHVEAGLRCFDRSMPEEINRIIADQVAQYRFAPTVQSQDNLIAEGIDPESIVVTGNTIVDAISRHRELADRKSSIHRDLDLVPGEYWLVTAHRQGNVDDPERFKGLLDGIGRAAEAFGVEAAYPMHPRARQRLDEFEISLPPRIRPLDPVGYLDFLALEEHAELIITDSGGVQEEACILGIPCVTVREQTERPETLAVGANVLATPDPASIADGVTRMINADRSWQNPFGDGTAGRRIVAEIADRPTLVAI